MKKLNFLRVFTAIALFVAFAYSANAQVTAPGWDMAASGYGVAFRDSASEVPPQATNIDTVTVGSIMPYLVKGDLQMHNLRRIGALDYSDFAWSLQSGGALRAADGTSAYSATTNAKDTVVTVAWGTTTGTYNIRVQEKPVAASGQPAFTCTGNSQLLPVLVVARPTAAWNGAASLSGCNVAGNDVNIPYRVTGVGQFAITYRITFTPLSGTSTNVVATGTAVNNLGTYKSGNQDFNLTYSVPDATYGRYDVYIESVSDRISRKSGVTSVAGDYPAAALTFYSYPTPVTQPIQHVKNM